MDGPHELRVIVHPSYESPTQVEGQLSMFAPEFQVCKFPSINSSKNTTKEKLNG